MSDETRSDLARKAALHLLGRILTGSVNAQDALALAEAAVLLVELSEREIWLHPQHAPPHDTSTDKQTPIKRK